MSSSSCPPYLCIHGVCLESNGSSENVESVKTYQCHCDPGWQDDNSMFRLPNSCSIPDHGLLGIFLTCTVITIPLFVLFAKATYKAKGRMKKTGIALLLSISMFPFCSLAVWIENGMFEASSVWLGLNMGAVNYVSQTMLTMTLAPIAAIKHHDVSERTMRRMHAMMWIFRAILVVPCLVLSAVSRTELHNSCLVAVLAITGLVAVLSGLVQLQYIRHLIDAVRQMAGQLRQIGETDVGALIGKMEKSKRGIMIYTMNQFVVYPLIIGVFFGLGQQFPFVWCLWFLLVIGQLLKYYSCLALFRNASIQSTSKAGGDPMRSKQDQIGPATVVDSTLDYHVTSSL